MGKIKMSQKRKQSILKTRKSTSNLRTNKKNMKIKATVALRNTNLTEVDPIADLLDPDLIGSAIMQCLIENDPEGVMQIIEDHLYALNKSKFLREAEVPRSTMYQLLKRKNPTIKTLAKIMYATHHLNTL